MIQEDRKNPNLLFVGTDLGVYVTLDGGQHWASMRGDMPPVPVHDLVVHPRENDLVVGTHGRGFYITDISPLQEMTTDVLGRDVHLFDVEPVVQWKLTSQPATSAQNFDGENAYHGVTVNYYLKEGVGTDVKVGIYQGDLLLQEIVGPGSAGLNQVRWAMTKKRPRNAVQAYTYRRFRETAAGVSPPSARALQATGVYNERQEWVSDWALPHDSEAEYGIEYFDYYDQLEWYGDEDDEVSVTGRSLLTRRHVHLEALDPDYVYTRVTPGEYAVVLKAGDTVLESTVVIMKDHWVRQP